MYKSYSFMIQVNILKEIIIFLDYFIFLTVPFSNLILEDALNTFYMNICTSFNCTDIFPYCILKLLRFNWLKIKTYIWIVLMSESNFKPLQHFFVGSSTFCSTCFCRMQIRVPCLPTDNNANIVLQITKYYHAQEINVSLYTNFRARYFLGNRKFQTSKIT